MYCVFNYKSECDACGRCSEKNKENYEMLLWDFNSHEGQDEFIEDVWSFVFTADRPSGEKTKVISCFLQRFFEDTEEEMIDRAMRIIT
jgi:hypothetical protein